MIFLTLFWEFCKTGLFAIGGGLATLPFLAELTEKYNWFTTGQLADMVAISESTPGAIGINMSTYAGYHAAGILGGIAATLALTFPSIVIIIIVARMLEKFNENKYVVSVFGVLRPVVVGLIAAAGYQIFKVSIIHVDAFIQNKSLGTLFDIKAGLLFLVLFAAIMKFQKHPIIYIGIGAVAGILLQM